MTKSFEKEDIYIVINNTCIAYILKVKKSADFTFQSQKICGNRDDEKSAYMNQKS